MHEFVSSLDSIINHSSICIHSAKEFAMVGKWIRMYKKWMIMPSMSMYILISQRTVGTNREGVFLLCNCKLIM
jgi:hypothetical protein